MSNYGDIDFDFDECAASHPSRRITEEEKQAQQKEYEEFKRMEAERKKQEKAFSDSLRTEKVKKRVKWLSKMIAEDEYDLEDYLLEEGFDDKYSLSSFFGELMMVGAIKKNIMIALMDARGFFDCIDERIKEIEGEEHEEWWNTQGRYEHFRY